MPRLFSVKMIVQPDGERLPILLDASRQPIGWANEYILYGRRTRVMPRTLLRELRALGYLHEWAQVKDIDLMARLMSGNGLTADEIEMHLFPWMRQDFHESRAVRSLVVGREEQDYRMDTVWKFMKNQMEAAITRIPVGDVRIDHIQAKIGIMAKVFGQLKTDVRNTQKGKKQGLSREQVHRLLTVCHPDYPDNPWQKHVRMRNYLIILLLLIFALRRGELLKLYVTDLGSLRGGEPMLKVVRRPDDPNDPRADEPSVKTQSRILPCEPFLAQLINGYMVNERSKLPKIHRKFPFLVLSENGNPLVLSSVNRILEQLAARFPEFDGLTPHILRHTCDTSLADKAAELGIDEDRFIKHLKYYNGWLGDNSETYTELHIRNEAHRLSRAWQSELFKPDEDIPF